MLSNINKNFDIFIAEDRGIEGRNQSKINSRIIASEYFIAVLGKDEARKTHDEIEIAMNNYRKYGHPTVEVCILDSDGVADATKALAEQMYYDEEYYVSFRDEEDLIKQVRIDFMQE